MEANKIISYHKCNQRDINEFFKRKRVPLKSHKKPQSKRDKVISVQIKHHATWLDRLMEMSKKLEDIKI